jgi:hypothetical protein
MHVATSRGTFDGGTGVSDHSGEGSDANREIEDAVVSYLRNHPDAADTLEGIVLWWLPLQRYEIGKARIERVLAQLIDAGILRGDQLPGGNKLYSFAEDAVRSPREP